MGEEKKVKVKNDKLKKFLTYAGVVALILAAVIISLLFYRQKIETTRDVFKNLTEDWQTFKSDKYGFSFKYPKDWEMSDTGGVPKDPSIYYIVREKKNKDKILEESTIYLRVSDQRTVKNENPGDAIQISIPFDKKNYLIFSTSTNNNQKEIFYNIPVTLVIGK